MNANQNNRYYYAFFTVALCATIVPLWLVEVPPLVDLPNHLARIFVLINYDQTPFFQQNFQVAYEPIPNMAIDLIVIPLTNLFDIFTADHIFLTLTSVLFALGCHLTGERKAGKVSFSAVFAVFLVYSGTFFYGYVNYVFSVALFLIAFGCWLRWRESFSVGQFLTLVGLTAAIFLAHLSAFVFFAIAIFIVNVFEWFFEAEEKRRWKFYAADCSLFIAPAIAFLTFMKCDGKVGLLRWNTLSGKAVAFFSAFRSYDLWLDLFCVTEVAAFCFWLKRRGEMNFDRRILVAALSFLLIFLVAPKYFFTGDADLRIVLPGFAPLILSCKINMLTEKTFALFVIVLALFSLRQAAISYRWIQMSEKITAERKLLEAIAPESKIYQLFVNESDNPEEKLERPLEHVVHFATIKNSSIAPTLFAYRGQQPLIFRQKPEFATLASADETRWLQNLKDYDYVWTYGVAPHVLNELAGRGITVTESGKTKIWKLNK
jgi:hypothetical protein